MFLETNDKRNELDYFYGRTRHWQVAISGLNLTVTTDKNKIKVVYESKIKERKK